VLGHSIAVTTEQRVYKFPLWALAVLALLVPVVAISFWNAISYMVSQWNVAEFSHGYLIPLIAGFLIWQRRKLLERIDCSIGVWAGFAVLVGGIALDILGRLSALYVLQHLALLIVIAGLTLAMVGSKALRLLATPLGILIFMVPLPNLLLNNLSSQLQLISSSLGVWMLRLTGTSVFLEGNVIDLGSYRLEVAQACSGLRYLFPLMTLAFLMACFFKAPLWKRAVLFLSSIPITLVMNGLRIAIIGVTVDHWGSQMAEGMLHEVQGWMVFIISTAVLVIEAVALARIGGDRRPWQEVFSMEMPKPSEGSAAPMSRRLSAAFLASAAVLLVFSGAVLALPSAVEEFPVRESFVTFPLQLGDWSGRREVMQADYLDALKLDDYLLADYFRSDGQVINLYAAWYNSQRTGEATHSPKACLPGGGWRIQSLAQTTVDGVEVGGQPLRVNRALIQSDDQRQLVYYWFLQRGRVVTNEYLVKWYLFVDSVTRHRSDGALVRLVIPISPGASPLQADQELRSFAATIASKLPRFIPG